MIWRRPLTRPLLVASCAALIAGACSAGASGAEHAADNSDLGTTATAPDGGELAAAPTSAGRNPATSTTTDPSPTTSTTIAGTTIASTTSTTSSTAPPTLADRFAAALQPVEALATPVPVEVRDSVARLWLLLGRPPTGAELTRGVRAVLVERHPMSDLARLLIASRESVVAGPDASSEDFVRTLYEATSGRPPSHAEVAAWVAGIAGGADRGGVAAWMTESPEAVAITGTSRRGEVPALAVDGTSRGESDSVLRLYLGLLQRFPSTAELQRAVLRYVDGTPLASLAAEIMSTDEYRLRRSASDHRAVVRGLYEDVLGGDVDEVGRQHWIEELEHGTAPAVVAVALSESPEAVARTGTAPPILPARLLPAGAILDGSGILAVGDSVMLGAADALRATLPGVTVDAAVGRQFSEGLSIVLSLAESGDLPGTVVFHLGTNGTVGAGRCDELMQILGDRTVVLVNVHVPRSWEATNNDVLAACAARHGARLVDWHTNATGLAGDGYHMGSSGAGQYAALVAAALAPTV